MSSFRLKSGDVDFNSRVDALFSSLQTAATELEPQTKRKYQEEEEEEEEKQQQDGGKDKQGFRQPLGRPPQWRGRGRPGGRGGLGPRNPTPDYIKNPEKWTKYSMKETKVLSDSENKREGIRLLADLEDRSNESKERNEETMECDEDTHPKIVFKKPSAVCSNLDTKHEELCEETEEDISPEFGGSRKFVAEEYVVGRSKPKSRIKHAGNSKTEKEAQKKEVKLSYLMFEEED